MSTLITRLREWVQTDRLLFGDSDRSKIVAEAADELERQANSAALAQRADEPVAPVTKHSATFRRLWDESPVTAQTAAPAYVPLEDNTIWQTYKDSALQGPEGVLLNFARAIESLVVARIKGTP